MSNRQTYTAYSSAEAEIYATDRCTKNILYLMYIINDIGLTKKLVQTAVHIQNDNEVCESWSKSMAAKGFCHVHIYKNATREKVNQWV